MNVRTTIVLFLTALCVSAFADDKKLKEEKPAAEPSATIDAGDADAIKAAIGNKATVTGTIEKAAWSRSGKVMQISFKNAEKSKFNAVVFSKNKDALDKKFDGDAAKALTGAKVKITGKVSEFAPRNKPDDKRPQIVIDDVDQIEVLAADKK